jgi:hypothetical protein
MSGCPAPPYARWRHITQSAAKDLQQNTLHVAKLKEEARLKNGLKFFDPVVTQPAPTPAEPEVEAVPEAEAVPEVVEAVAEILDPPEATLSPLPSKGQLLKMTVGELAEVAVSRGVPLPEEVTKAEIIRLLLASK